MFLLLKRKIGKTPILALLSLQRLFKMEIDMFEYTMRVILMQDDQHYVVGGF